MVSCWSSVGIYSMKKRHIIYIRFLFLLIVGAASCSKHGNVAADNGCIERVIPQHTETTLRTTQIDSIMALFSKNNISTDQLQFIQFIPNIYVDPVRTPQAQVRANLFVNGLPVFRYNEVFVFNDGIFDTAYLYTGAPLSNDTTSIDPLLTCVVLSYNAFIHPLLHLLFLLQIPIQTNAWLQCWDMLMPSTFRKSPLPGVSR
jgi:hypothetical protein